MLNYFDSMAFYKYFLSNTENDNMIIKACNFLENLKKECKNLFFNNQFIVQIEESNKFLIKFKIEKNLNYLVFFYLIH